MKSPPRNSIFVFSETSPSKSGDSNTISSMPTVLLNLYYVNSNQLYGVVLEYSRHMATSSV
jgi:hypothetical protein